MRVASTTCPGRRCPRLQPASGPIAQRRQPGGPAAGAFPRRPPVPQWRHDGANRVRSQPRLAPDPADGASSSRPRCPCRTSTRRCIATALPTMAHTFGYDPVRMNVALTSYLLSLAVFIPASGWIADRFGAKNVFRWAIIIFTVGAMPVRPVPHPARFWSASRILQGMGGAMMVPVGRLLLLRTAAKPSWSSAWPGSPPPRCSGPSRPADRRVHRDVSGLALDVLHQRPDRHSGPRAGLAVHRGRREPPRGRFDVSGLVLSSITLIGLMFGLETLGRHFVAPG